MYLLYQPLLVTPSKAHGSTSVWETSIENPIYISICESIEYHTVAMAAGAMHRAANNVT